MVGFRHSAWVIVVAGAAAAVAAAMVAGRAGRADWLAAIRTAAPANDHCAPLMDDSAVAFVMLHQDLERAIRRGQLGRARENSAAMARHLTVVDPVAAAAAFHLAEARDPDIARQRFETVQRLLEDPGRPRASDRRQPGVTVAPAGN